MLLSSRWLQTRPSEVQKRWNRDGKKNQKHSNACNILSNFSKVSLKNPHFFQTHNVTLNFKRAPSGAYSSSVTFWSFVVLKQTWGESTASLQYYRWQNHEYQTTWSDSGIKTHDTQQLVAVKRKCLYKLCFLSV